MFYDKSFNQFLQDVLRYHCKMIIQVIDWLIDLGIDIQLRIQTLYDK